MLEFAANAMRAVRTAHERRRRRNGAIAELHALSDRSLADIGIERSQIEATVWFAGRDASRRNR